MWRQESVPQVTDCVIDQINMSLPIPNHLFQVTI